MLKSIKNLFEKYNSLTKEIIDFQKSNNAKQYSPEGLANTLKQKIDELINRIKPELDRLRKESEVNLESAKRNLQSVKFPLLTSKEANSKIAGELQLQDAKNALTQKPEAVLKALEFNKSIGRLDFVNFVLDNYDMSTSVELTRYKENYLKETGIMKPLEEAAYNSKLVGYFSKKFSSINPQLYPSMPGVIHFPIDMKVIQSMPQNVVHANIDAVNASMEFNNTTE